MRKATPKTAAPKTAPPAETPPATLPSAAKPRPGKIRIVSDQVEFIEKGHLRLKRNVRDASWAYAPISIPAIGYEGVVIPSPPTDRVSTIRVSPHIPTRWQGWTPAKVSTVYA